MFPYRVVLPIFNIDHTVASFATAQEAWDACILLTYEAATNYRVRYPIN